MDQQCNEVGSLKYVVKLQAGICKQVRAGAVEVKARRDRGTASHFILGESF